MKTQNLNLDTDLLSLPEDLASQASQYGKVGEEWADADKAKDECYAKFDKKIRKEFTEKDEKGKSPSEAYVKTQIEVQQEYIDACHEVNRLQMQLKSLDHRGRSMEGLIKLYTTETFFDLKTGNISPELRKKFKGMKADVDQEENLEKAGNKLRDRKNKRNRK